MANKDNPCEIEYDLLSDEAREWIMAIDCIDPIYGSMEVLEKLLESAPDERFRLWLSLRIKDRTKNLT